MRKVITILLFVIALNFTIFAQDEEDTEKADCPTIEITAPPTSVKPGETQTFILKVSGEKVEADKLEIVWSVENAEIVEGQGTKTLVIKDTENKGVVVKVTANVKAGDCNLSATESGIVADPPSPILIDEFGRIASGDIKARMDAFMVDLQNRKGSQGYIINFGTDRNIAIREKFFRNYIRLRRFDSKRFIFVNGGKEKSTRTRFWLVPVGAKASEIN